MIYEELFRQFGESSYSEFNLVQGAQELSLKKGIGGSSKSLFQAEKLEQTAVSAANAAGAAISENKDLSSANEEKSGNFIKALRVGFFKPAVKKGDSLQEGQLFGYISAMNIRHEQKVLRGGIVKSLLVEDGDGVAYGDSIIELE